MMKNADAIPKDKRTRESLVKQSTKYASSILFVYWLLTQGCSCTRVAFGRDLSFYAMKSSNGSAGGSMHRFRGTARRSSCLRTSSSAVCTRHRLLTRLGRKQFRSRTMKQECLNFLSHLIQMHAIVAENLISNTFRW